MENTENGVISATRTEKSAVFFDYLPALVSLLLTLITLILYITVIPNHYYSLYLGMAVIAVVPFAIVFVNRKWKLGVPNYLVCLMCSHAILSVDMGSTLGVYGIFPWWDSAVHTYFGFLCCAVLYYLYIRLKGEQPKLVDYIVMVLLVLSVAAIWEVYEFVASFIFESDMQDVARSIEAGIHPLTDTVVDMCIATLGAVIFPVGLFLKRRLIDCRKKNRQ